MRSVLSRASRILTFVSVTVIAIVAIALLSQLIFFSRIGVGLVWNSQETWATRLAVSATNGYVSVGVFAQPNPPDSLAKEMQSLGWPEPPALRIDKWNASSRIFTSEAVSYPFGFVVDRRTHDDGEWANTMYAAPQWLVAAVLGLISGSLIVLWTRRLLRDRRKFAAGLCRACGYDLRSGHERCPECGADE